MILSKNDVLIKGRSDVLTEVLDEVQVSLFMTLAPRLKCLTPQLAGDSGCQQKVTHNIFF